MRNAKKTTKAAPVKSKPVRGGKPTRIINPAWTDVEKLFYLTQPELKRHLRDRLESLGYSPCMHKGFIYAEGTHPVLLVAHTDTVHREPVKTICKSDDGQLWMSPQGIGGDDRAGIHMVLSILKTLHCSVVFTEDEEIGGVGATAFAGSGIIPPVHYIVELDRQGANDAVFYDCENPAFTALIEGAGFKKASGTFSDISIIAPMLRIAAVNLSTGYFNAHTQHEYVDFSIVERNIQRVQELISKPTASFEYMESMDDSLLWARRYFSARYQEDWGNDWVELCPFEGQVTNGTDFYKTNDDTYYIDPRNDVYEVVDFDEFLAVRRDDLAAFGADGREPQFDEGEAVFAECIAIDAYRQMLVEEASAL